MSINIQTENNELKKIAGTHGTDNTSHVTIDSELSTESENPIQNKVITKELNDLGNTIGAIRLTKEYITEHNTLTSFISGLKENTCYIFYGAQAARSEMTILHNIGLIPKYGEGFLKILCSLNHYSINVEYNNTDRRLISYNPTVPGNYQLSDWYSLATTEGTVNHASNADNADTVDGYHVNDSATANPYGKIPRIDTNGVMEVGKYIDFHNPNSSNDFDVRVNIDNGNNVECNAPFYATRLIARQSYSGYGPAQITAQNTNYPNARVQLFVDQEGSNLRLSTNEEGNYYEFDTLGNNIRLYHYYKGKTPSLISSSGSGENLELNINGTAAKATKDSDGNVIKDTYAKKNEISSGGYVKGDSPEFKNIISSGNVRVGSINYQHLLMTCDGGMSRYVVKISGQNAEFGIRLSNSGTNLVAVLPYTSMGGPTGSTGNLGASNTAWSDIYSKNALSVVSDKNKKSNIQELDSDLVSQIVEKFMPVSYLLKDGESGRRHYGMIAQQIEKVLKELDIDSSDFAPFIKSPVIEDTIGEIYDKDGTLVLDEDGTPVEGVIGKRETGDYIYNLRYGELLPLLWKNVQDKTAEIRRLREENETFNTKIITLEQRVSKLEEILANEKLC